MADDLHTNVYSLEGFWDVWVHQIETWTCRLVPIVVPIFQTCHYSIPHPNTRSTRAHLEKLLTSIDHDVAHATNVIDCDCPTFQWHIAQLPPNKPKGC